PPAPDWHTLPYPHHRRQRCSVTRSAVPRDARRSAPFEALHGRTADGRHRCGDINAPDAGPSDHAARNTTTSACTASPYSYLSTALPVLSTTRPASRAASWIWASLCT